jgi:uncharacterized membrane protein YbhN (UPF0104 family)
MTIQQLRYFLGVGIALMVMAARSLGPLGKTAWQIAFATGLGVVLFAAASFLVREGRAVARGRARKAGDKKNRKISLHMRTK